MRRASTRQSWTSEQDRFALSHAVAESARVLGRTVVSVAVRRGRLRRMQKKYEFQLVTE
jgi:hypothetical protein